MEMEKEYSNNGKLVCNKNILYSIVSLATKEISGVVSLSKKTGKFSSIVKNRNFNGIQVRYDINGLLIVDVYINVYNTISAPDLCFKVQENIKNNILSMVDLKTAKVNVHIVDVIIKKEEENENPV